MTQEFINNLKSVIEEFHNSGREYSFSIGFYDRETDEYRKLDLTVRANSHMEIVRLIRRICMHICWEVADIAAEPFVMRHLTGLYDEEA